MASTIETVFNELETEGTVYCMLCLRTSNERRLVKPENLKKFLKVVKLENNSMKNIRWKYSWICFICDRLVETALRLHSYVEFAALTHALHKEYYALTKWERKKIDWKSKAASWSKQMTYVREKTDIIQTETLCVEVVSDMIFPPDERGEPKLIIPDQIHDDTRDALRDVSIPQSSPIVIFDDDEPDKRTNALTLNKQTITKRNTIQSQSVLPFKSITPALPNSTILQSVITSPASTNALVSSWILHPIVLQNAKLVDNQLVIDETANAVDNNAYSVKPATIATSAAPAQKSAETQTNASKFPTKMVENSKRGNTDDGCSKKIRTEMKLQINKISSEGPNIVNDNCGITAEKRRNLSKKDSKVDWEDKIPMDVIVCVNQESNNTSSVGNNATSDFNPVITGVVSTTEDEFTQTSHNYEEMEVIDLC